MKMPELLTEAEFMEKRRMIQIEAEDCTSKRRWLKPKQNLRRPLLDVTKVRED